MNTKHTPGPWEARNGEVTTQQDNGRSYRRIAAVQDYGMGSLPEVDSANAQLIASAPELLDLVDYALKVALVERLQLLEDGHQPDGMTVRGIEIEIAKYESAIARATGKAQS